MPSLTRLRPYLVPALSLTALAALAWLTRQVWCEADLRSQAQTLQEVADLLDRADAAVQARLRFKQALGEGLVAGRLSLAEAAAKMRDYMAAEPEPYRAEGRQRLAEAFPGGTEEERCARNLALWVRNWANAYPGVEVEAAARRVEGELAAAYGSR